MGDRRRREVHRQLTGEGSIVVQLFDQLVEKAGSEKGVTKADLEAAKRKINHEIDGLLVAVKSVEPSEQPASSGPLPAVQMMSYPNTEKL